MAFALGLYLDSNTNKVLRDLRKNLISNRLIDTKFENYVSHVTFFICDHIDLVKASEKINRVSNKIDFFPLYLNKVSYFPKSGTIFYEIENSKELADIHKIIFDEFSEISEGTWKYYTPSEWIPHCTVALDIEKKYKDEIIHECKGLNLPQKMSPSKIGLVEFYPVKYLFSTPVKVKA